MPFIRKFRRFGRKPSKVSKNVRKYVKKVVEHAGEIKQYQVDDDNVALTTAGVIYPVLDLMTQGAGDGNRIGDQIKTMWFRLRMGYAATAASTNGFTVGNIMRLIIFSMKDARGATPAVSGTGISVLETPANAGNLIHSEIREQFKAISHIYYDKTISLNPPEVLATTSVGFTAAANSALQHVKQQHLNILKKFKLGLKTTFNSNAGTPAQLGKNQLFILLITDQTNNTPQVDYVMSIGYTDC